MQQKSVFGTRKIRVAVLTNLMSNYREAFYRGIFGLTELETTVYCQAEVPGSGIPTVHDRFPGMVKLITFMAIGKEKLVWQFLPFWEIWKKYDIVFVAGNPRYISQALLATFLRLFGKKVVIWGQVHTFSNNKITKKIRLFWLRWFDHFLVYTEHEKVILARQGFRNKNIVSINNGLEQEKINRAIGYWHDERLEQWQNSHRLQNKIPVLSCGRLLTGKYDLMVEALPLLLDSIPNLYWCIIGDGPGRQALEQKTTALGISEGVHFVGAVYEEKALAPWFMSAKLFIHPGAIGLSLLHAFGYGLPVVTHNNANTHGPEYALFEDGLTGQSFESGNLADLVDKVITMLTKRKELEAMGKRVKAIVQTQYNSKVMVRRFLDMAQNVAGG